MEFVFAIVALIVLIWCWDIYRNRNPLDSEEISRLAKVRQRNEALAKYRFTHSEQRVDPIQKKAMKSEGELLRCDLDYNTAPAWVAAMLKYKKHEWIVIGFVYSFRVRMLWWNKGPNKNTVWPFLSYYNLDLLIENTRSEAIIVLHNHPNPNPNVYSLNHPSKQDLKSAVNLRNEIVPKHNVSLLEFVCERGIPYLYYASFSEREIPIHPIIQQIQDMNGTKIMANYKLRKELQKSNKSIGIPESDLN